MHYFVVYAVLLACVCASSLDGMNVMKVLEMSFPGSTRAPRGNGTVKFTPHELPCDYIISQATYLESMLLAQADMFVRGDFFGVSAETIIMGVGGYAVFRPDTNFTDGGVTYLYAFCGIKSNGEKDCQTNVTSWDYYKELVDGYLRKFREPSYFDRAYDSEFHDVKCKAYVDDENNVTYYVNKDDYLIGIEGAGSNLTGSVRISYTMKAELKMFKIDKEEYSMCNKSAYEMPKKSADQCSASVVHAALIFIITSLVLSLLL